MADDPDMMDTLTHVCPDTSQASWVSSNVWIKQVNPPCAKSATPAAITDNHLSFIDTTSTTISSSPFNATLPVAPVANFSHGRCEGIDLCGPCALSQQAHPDPQLQYARYHPEDNVQCMQSSLDYNFAGIERTFCDQNGQKQPMQPCVSWENFTFSQQGYDKQLSLDSRCFLNNLASEATQPNFMSYSASENQSGSSHNNARDHNFGFSSMHDTYNHSSVEIHINYFTFSYPSWNLFIRWSNALITLLVATTALSLRD
ncbi:hypothetical protein F5883DRAFT_566583 [Diaporthe sp. PMI_573]|nr:hypothetical protein F5883DRAFT_566583 [Diaporthaceae sp. PMI_573]